MARRLWGCDLQFGRALLNKPLVIRDIVVLALLRIGPIRELFNKAVRKGSFLIVVMGPWRGHFHEASARGRFG